MCWYTGPAFNLFLERCNFNIGPFKVDKYTSPAVSYKDVQINCMLHVVGKVLLYMHAFTITINAYFRFSFPFLPSLNLSLSLFLPPSPFLIDFFLCLLISFCSGSFERKLHNDKYSSS